MIAFLNKYVIGAVLLVMSLFAVWFSGSRSAKKDAEIDTAHDETKRVRDEATATVAATEHRTETVRKANDVQAAINRDGGSSVERLRKSEWNTDNQNR